MKIVVVGAGQAAASFAAKLVERLPDAQITIVGDEASLPYQRPPLSKKYMTGEMTADRLLLRPAEWYAEHKVDVLAGISAVEVSRADKTVRLADGRSLAYDRLLLATGTTPRRLPAAIGGDLAGVYTLRTLADADAMAAEFSPGRRVLVVGGGYIGLEAAAVAALRGLTVHLAEMAPRILQRVASPETAGYFRDLHRRHGVALMEGAQLSRLVGTSGCVTGAEFADGTKIDVDFVLVGIGVAPNTGLAEKAGLAIDNGIAVDLCGRTSDADIYAAGDCASFALGGELTRLESVQNAIEQAEAAACAIAGDAVEYRPVPWFWSDQYDVKLQIAGLHRGYDRTVVRPGAREGSQSIWYFRGSDFIAVDAMNDPRAYMFGKRLLEGGRNVTPEQAADAGFDLKTLL